MNGVLSKQLKKAEKYYKELEAEHESSKKRLNDQLFNFYNMLSVVTLKEANKYLNDNELVDFKRNVKYYLTDEIGNVWRKELEALTSRSRVSKIKSLFVDIEHELERLAYKETKDLEELTKDIYEDVYYQELFLLSVKLGYSRKFNSLDFSKYDKLVNKGWSDDNLTFNDRVLNRKIKNNNYLKKHLIQSIKMNEDPIKPMNVVNKRIDNNKSSAGRLIMTESAYYSSESRNESFDEFEVEQYQIIATLDDRTSDICQDMDLQIFNMSEYEVGITASPFHPWCRTVEIPYFDDNITTRLARTESGDWEHIDKDISYKDWRKKYVK